MHWLWNVHKISAQCDVHKLNNFPNVLYKSFDQGFDTQGETTALYIINAISNVVIVFNSVIICNLRIKVYKSIYTKGCHM